MQRQSKMKVTIADSAGFCVGVKRALSEIDKLAGKKDVYVLGKLIHNQQVVEDLEKRGVRSVGDIKDVPAKSSIVITAHGAPAKKIEDLKSFGFNVIDLTCPLVKRVHDITMAAEAEGDRVIIFGDREHIEVKGIAGNLHEPIIISDLSGIDGIDQARNYCLVSQTTQNVEKFDKIAGGMKKIINSLKVCNTICEPTKQRQKSAVELAKRCDLMIVVGGSMSANTKKLRQRCSEMTKTVHIETEQELKPEWFLGKENIGITAGASTPDYIIKKIVEKIEDEFSG